MKIKQKIAALVVTIGSVLAFGGVLSPVADAADCGGVTTTIVSCPQGNSGGTRDNGVWGILLLALNIMTAGIGILAVGGIVVGAIMYASAEENASQVQKAKDIIKNVIIGLIAYGAMYLLLNFLIPGGIFEG